MFTVSLLNEIRANEIDKVTPHLPPGAHILEIGAGTGKQALALSERGFRVDAVEIPASNYAADRLFPITDYDGRHLPFPDATFDVVFSSNVLEHVPDLPALYAEIRRTLRPGGVCVHVLPTHVWRFWTFVSAFPEGFRKALGYVPSRWRQTPTLGGKLGVLLVAPFMALRFLLAPFYMSRHGEHGTGLGELWLFRPAWWRKNFRANGFEIVADEPMGLFYTGHLVFGRRCSLSRRGRLARRLGSACHLFRLRVAGPRPPS